MNNDFQKASLWKRISAGLFDGLMLALLAVGIAYLLSLAFDYDGHTNALNDTYLQYESQYGVTFDITEEQYNALSAEAKQSYDAAYEALISDEQAMATYNTVVNLMLTITTLSILISVVLWELVVPLILGNGQTLGKKVFAICLMRTDSVKLTALQLFVRTVLGKFTLEIMIPVYVLYTLFWGTVNLFGLVLLAALALTQAILFVTTKAHSQLHDLLAGTVVVDYASQQIFNTTEDLIEYQKRVAADRAARESY